VKGSFITVLVILVVSLAIWSAFYAMTEPLQSDETMIVVGVCAAMVLFAKWVLNRFIKKEVKSEQKK
jgi:hypothetical protein